MPDLRALPAEELMQVTLEARSAAGLVLAAAPKVRSLQEQIVKAIPGFDATLIDQVEDAAVALHQAESDRLAASGPPNAFDESLVEASRLRELLLADVNNLVVRGLLDGSPVEELKGPTGHKNLASDLGALSSLVERNWDRIQGKTAVEPQELARARALSLEIVTKVAMRAQSEPVVTDASDIRNRAFTLLARRYDKLRQAVSFLRWEQDDVDNFTPSLFSSRAPRRKSREEPPEPPVAGGTKPSDGVPPGGATTGVGTTTSVPAGSVTGGKAPGTPGSEPFVNS
jgi:hypothetical protein